MASDYPGGLDSYTSKSTSDDVLAAHVNDLQDAVVAIQTELGTDPAGSETDVDARIQAIEDADNLTPAKKRRVNISSVKPDSDNPPSESLTDTTTGTNPVSINAMWFDSSADEKIHFAFNVPPDCNTDYAMTLYLDCMVADNGDTGETVGIEINYICVGHNESITGATEYNSAITGGLDVAAWVAGKKYLVDDLTISASYLASGDTVYVTLFRDVDDDDDYPHDFGITNIAIEYTNKNPA